jgi:hypothetical protein
MPESPRDAVLAFARARPTALFFDAGTGALLDVPSGKTLVLDFLRIGSAVERRNTESGAPYLVLVRDDGLQLALADVGVAFAPLAPGGVPLPDLPPVVCLRDCSRTAAQLTHFLLDHPDEEPTREHLLMLFFCMAVLAGARAAGFEVAPEERELERILNEIEARKKAGG